MKKRFLLFIFLVFSAVAIAQSNYSLAENYFRNDEFEKATTLFKKLVRKSPYNTTYLQRLVACYQETNKFQVAENLLKSKIKQKPHLSYLNVLLGYNYERQQNQIEANKHYDIALQSINKNAKYGGTIANTFKTFNKLDFAIKAYKKTSEFNKNANYGFNIAQLYGEQGKFEQMFESYINYVDKDERFLKTVKRFTAKYITDNAENENNILFKKALLRRSASNPKDTWNNLLSWLFVKQKDYGKALIQYKALYARDPDNLAGIKQLGKIAFEHKDYEIAKECFEMVIEKTNYPKDKFNAIHMNLLTAVETEQPDVEQQFQKVFSEYGVNKNTTSLQVAYANYLIFKKNNPEKAIEVLEKALELSNSKYQKAYIKLQLADALVYQNKFNKALIYYTQIQNQFKNHKYAHSARFKVAQTSYFKNDFKWAKAQLKILKGSATQLIANDAADLFLTISDNQPKDSTSTGLTKYAKADLLAFQNKNDEAIAILDDIIIKFKGQPIEDEAVFKRAKLYVKQGKYDEAILNFTNVIAIDEKGIFADDAYYLMAKLYSTKLNNPKKAQEYYEKIIFNYPNSIYLVDARKKYRKIRGDEI